MVPPQPPHPPTRRVALYPTALSTLHLTTFPTSVLNLILNLILNLTLNLTINLTINLTLNQTPHLTPHLTLHLTLHLTPHLTLRTAPVLSIELNHISHPGRCDARVASTPPAHKAPGPRAPQPFCTQLTPQLAPPAAHAPARICRC